LMHPHTWCSRYQTTVIWDVMPCNLIDVYRDSGGAHCFHLILSCKWKHKFLRNISNHLLDYAVSHRRRQSLLWNPQISQYHVTEK
jgi:hypothetical protein